MSVTAEALPADALLARYAEPADGNYTDSFRADVERPVDLAEFVTAFYTTWLFRLERVVLRVLKLPSSDSAAEAVARGVIDRFAAWSVEARSDRQLLMCDVQGRTRSWFMVVANGEGTALWFGSAVVANRETGAAGRRLGYRWLLGLHKVYSRLLLAAARRKLVR